MYSPVLGEVAAELRENTVPVVDDLNRIAVAPDLIHGQHHLETMTALTHFPDCPALFVCHGWLPDAEAPPRHPRIFRYLAVDELVATRLRDECAIDRERTLTQLNFVDLERFQPRTDLPARPRRALVVSNHVSEANWLSQLREACASREIGLEAIGTAVGNPHPRPEELVPEYDLVFAKGRAALEAIAVGTAVVLCDRAGLGPLVTEENFSRCRSLNCGVRMLRDQPTVERIQRRLDRYDPDDARRVHQRLRQEAGLDRYLDHLLKVYETVLAEFGDAARDPASEARDLAHYLRHGPLQSGDLFHGERTRLQQDSVEVRAWAKQLNEEILHARQDIESLQARLAAEEVERQSLHSEMAQGREWAHSLHEQVLTLQQERAALDSGIERLLELPGPEREAAERPPSRPPLTLLEKLEQLATQLRTSRDRYAELAERYAELDTRETETRARLDRIRGTRTWRVREFLGRLLR